MAKLDILALGALALLSVTPSSVNAMSFQSAPQNSSGHAFAPQASDRVADDLADQRALQDFQSSARPVLSGRAMSNAGQPGTQPLVVQPLYAPR